MPPMRSPAHGCVRETRLVSVPVGLSNTRVAAEPTFRCRLLRVAHDGTPQSVAWRASPSPSISARFRNRFRTAVGRGQSARGGARRRPRRRAVERACRRQGAQMPSAD
jgi:hypothetical protein